MNNENQIENKSRLFKQEVPVEKIETVNQLSKAIIKSEGQALTQSLDQAAHLTDLKAETKHGKWKSTVEMHLEISQKKAERLLKLHKHRDALLEEMAKNDTTVSNLTSAYRFCNKIARELKIARKVATQVEKLDQIQTQVEAMAQDAITETVITMEPPAPEMHVEVELGEAA